MKIRHGFVGNSSTSSFLIFGVSLDAISPERIGQIKEDKVEVVRSPYSVYLGLSWAEVRDGETGWEFKRRIKHGVKIALEEAGVDEEIIDSLVYETHSEAWYDR